MSKYCLIILFLFCSPISAFVGTWQGVFKERTVQLMIDENYEIQQKSDDKTRNFQGIIIDDALRFSDKKVGATGKIVGDRLIMKDTVGQSYEYVPDKEFVQKNSIGTWKWVEEDGNTAFITIYENMLVDIYDLPERRKKRIYRQSMFAKKDESGVMRFFNVGSSLYMKDDKLIYHFYHKTFEAPNATMELERVNP